jgi:hypothetical protein
MSTFGIAILTGLALIVVIGLGTVAVLLGDVPDGDA